jgi:hypothetical protein
MAMEDVILLAVFIISWVRSVLHNLIRHPTR